MPYGCEQQECGRSASQLEYRLEETYEILCNRIAAGRFAHCTHPTVFVAPRVNCVVLAVMVAALARGRADEVRPICCSGGTTKDCATSRFLAAVPIRVVLANVF